MEYYKHVCKVCKSDCDGEFCSDDCYEEWMSGYGDYLYEQYKDKLLEERFNEG